MDIVVASMPRSGSTMVSRAIEGFGKGSTWPRHKAEIVHKSHRPAPMVLPKGCKKAIYIYGDVVKCVLSTHKRFSNDKPHFEWCGCYKDLEDIDIFKRDEMNLEKTFDSWLATNPYPVMILNYNAIPDHYDDIEKFVGRECNFPKWRSRNTKRNSHPQIESSYSSLIEKVKSAPDFEVRA